MTKEPMLQYRLSRATIATHESWHRKRRRLSLMAGHHREADIVRRVPNVC